MHNPAWKQSERKIGEKLVNVDGQVKQKYAKLVSSVRTGRMGFITSLEVDTLTRSYAVQQKHSTRNAKNPAINFSSEFIKHHLDMVNQHFPDLVPIWTIKVADNPILFVVPENEFMYLVQLKKIVDENKIGLEQLEKLIKGKDESINTK